MSSTGDWIGSRERRVRRFPKCRKGVFSGPRKTPENAGNRRKTKKSARENRRGAIFERAKWAISQVMQETHWSVWRAAEFACADDNEVWVGVCPLARSATLILGLRLSQLTGSSGNPVPSPSDAHGRSEAPLVSRCPFWMGRKMAHPVAIYRVP